MAEASFSRRVGWVLRGVFSRRRPGAAPSTPTGAVAAERMERVEAFGAAQPSRGARAPAERDAAGPTVDQGTISKNFQLIFIGLLVAICLFAILAVVLEINKLDASNLWTLTSSLVGGLLGLVVGKASK